MEEEIKFTIDDKKKMVDTIADDNASYGDKLAAYEYLLEEGEDVVDYMLSLIPNLQGESGQMIVEILANYKGRKDIFLWLVSYFYRGEDIPLFARLLGSYGDESAIDLLTSYARDYDVDYNEFIEIRNAVEELGGEFNVKKDFSDDPLFAYLKGEVETDIFKRTEADSETDADEEEDCECHHSKCSCGERHGHTVCHDHSACHGHSECDCNDCDECGRHSDEN